MGNSSIAVTLLCFFVFFILMMIVSLSASLRIVREDKRLAVYRLGRYLGDKGPGIVLLVPFIDRGILKDVGFVENTPSHRMTGIQGEARTTIYTDGKVSLAGEEWDAISPTPISAGERVRVVRMILEVVRE